MNEMKKWIIGIALILIVIMVANLTFHTEKSPGANLAKAKATIAVLSSDGLDPTNSGGPSAQLNMSAIKDDPRLAQAKIDFPKVSEVDLENALNIGMDLNALKEERVSDITIQTRNLEMALMKYRERFGTYPSGENLDVVKTLMGNNLQKTVFLNPPIRAISSDGELLDSWHTPFKIKIEKDAFSIRSAGPDLVFGTKDDIIVRHEK